MRHGATILAYCLSAFLAFASGNVTAAGVRERIYVQTDKQTYLPGEMLWFKAYLTGADGRPVSFSKTGYVELYDGDSPVVQAKIELSGGTGHGRMQLPVTLRTGYYFLTAYTRNMRNEGEAVFFHKTLSVINPFYVDKTIGIDSIPLPSPQPLPLQSPPPQPPAEAVTTVSLSLPFYPVRSEGEILIQGLPSGTHSLSLSVSGEDMAPLYGYTDIREWHKQLSLLPQTLMRADFLPEYEGHIVTGRLTDAATGNPPAERILPFLAFHGRGIRLFGGQVKEGGEVIFYTKGITGASLAATVAVPAGVTERSYRIDLQTPFVPVAHAATPPFRLDPSRGDELLRRSIAVQAMSIYTPYAESAAGDSGSFVRPPDRTYFLDEYTRFATMEEVVGEYVLGLAIRRERGRRYMSVMREDRIGRTLAGSSVNTLVLLDGIPVTDHDFICDYDPLQISRIDIYRGIYFFGGNHFDGIAFFTTYGNKYPDGLKNNGTHHAAIYEGPLPRLPFHSPSYPDEDARKNPAPDFRHTLLWMPEVGIDGGTSVAIPFSTSDYCGRFRVIVEGISAEGLPIHATATFDVK
ncbi:MAG: hypothetical protein LBI58_03670 [Tannerellaceae bacterium]|jgi:hypothetical protein|nr:hypothetical protein [Tannerellaceae bacterium]